MSRTVLPLVCAAWMPACLMVMATVCGVAASAADHLASPVFYELHPYRTQETIQLLRERTVVIPPYAPMDMTQFDWRDTGGRDFTWAIQMHELRFLVPLIADGSPEDRQLAREYFMAWHDAQGGDDLMRDRAARYPMSIAFRAMVFVYYLKSEEQRADADTEIVELLRTWIARHQALLADEQYFEGNSNHGLVEGMALLETTRVVPGVELRRLGLDRMLQITRKSVSELGVHMEHAPFYHFVYLRWLDQFSRYLESIPAVPAAPTAELERYRKKMQAVAFYLHDHAGAVAPIGDSHAVPVETAYQVDRPASGNPVLCDAEAGYAIYKALDPAEDRRYVVFATQNRKPALSFHYHNDALSVFYSDDGETILNDPGAFTYTTGKMRAFFASDRAHNTVYSAWSKRVNGFRPIARLRDVGYAVDRDGVSFRGVLSFSIGNVRRRVLIPAGEPAVVVIDTIGPKATPPSGRARRPRASVGFCITWNLGPDVVRVDAGEGRAANRREWLLETRRGSRYALSVVVSGAGEPGALKVEVHRGADAPLFGWNAPSFGVREPATTLVFTVQPGPEPVRVETRIERIE